MLRHISGSLAMTACATLIATNANAVNFTLTPLDSVQKKPGQNIAFRLDLDPQGSTLLMTGISAPTPFNSGNGTYDSNELSFGQIIPLNFSQFVITPTSIALLLFGVINPIRDGESDFTGVGVNYVNIKNPKEFRFQFVSSPRFDVQPVQAVQGNVPEPLTMFGAAAALGYGVILKRKSSKKTVS
jgi:hypothetical protein